MDKLLEGQLLRLVYKITNDERFEKGKKINLSELESIINEWRPVLTPLKDFYHDSWSSIVDIYFGDYKAAHERLTDEGAEVMARFGDSLKKIEEKIEK
jgi:hypothetical protein